jgi:histidinol-phosphate aminotransferase
MPARKIVSVLLRKSGGTFQLDVAGIKAALENPDNKIKLQFLTSPNNPTGGNLSPDDITAVIEHAAGKCIVVLDETYAEFTDQASFTSKFENYPHLVILRTLSKSYSLAGMRIGCAISSVPEMMQIMRTKVMETYPIARGSSEAALKVLQPEILKIARENIKKIVAERERMATFLHAQSDITHVYPSDANFLLVQMNKAREFYEFALSKGIILRDMSSAQGTENCIRLTIGTPAQNDLVMGLVKEFYS